MSTHTQLTANGASFYRLDDPQADTFYRVDIERLSESHMYILQDPGVSVQGLEVSDPAYLKTFAQAVTDGDCEITYYSETSYGLKFTSLTPVMLLRLTPVAALIDFQSSSGLREEDLDTATLQALYVAQEAREFSDRSGYENASGSPENLWRLDSETFTDGGTEWTFGAPDHTGTVAGDYLVFVDGTFIPSSYFSDKTGDGTNGVFGILKADYPSPTTFTLVNIKDYIEVYPTVADNSISSAKLQAGAVTETKLGDASVSTAKLQDASVSTAKLQDASVTAAKLAPGAVASTVTTEGTKITGDGSGGDPISLATYSRFDVTPGALLLDTPGAEDWVVFKRNTVGHTYANGVTLRSSSSASTWGSHIWKLAQRDHLVSCTILTNEATASIKVIRVRVASSATPATEADTKILLYMSPGNEAISFGSQAIIPKGMYFNVEIINNTNDASAELTAWLFPMDHRPV